MLNASDDPARMAERINVKHAVQMMALVGILLVCETLADHTEQGSPLSLSNEYSCRPLVVTMFVAQNMSARMM
jgi:hypothetical protein